VLQQILDESYEIWADELTPRAYAQYNLAQLRTPWGRHNLCRYALLDADGHVLTSAKRYGLHVRLDGREMAAVGIGAVYTPRAQRRGGHAAAIVNALVNDAAAAGAELAVLFSEIGTGYYERLGFVAVPRHELLLSVAEKPGAPMTLVRCGEERDIPAVAAIADAMSRPHRFAVGQNEDYIRYSLSRKRLLSGLLTPGALTVEFFIVEEGAGAVAFAILTVTPDDVILEMCGDRDPGGARLGALLQVLRARTPAEKAQGITCFLAPGWLPPQIEIESSGAVREVMMVKPLKEGVLTAPLRHSDVLYWHGDLF